MPVLKRGIAGLVLARLPAGDRSQVEGEVLAAYDASLRVLENLGAKLVDVQLPRSFAELGAMAGRIIGCEGYSYVGELVDDAAQLVDPHVRPRIALGKGVSARDYLRLLRDREQLKRDWSKALAGCDALLAPTTLTAAPRVADIDQSGTAAVITRAINLVDGCALAVRNGFTRGGMPTSLQIACRGYDEATALRIGWAYEQATNFKDVLPPLPASPR
jgi:aspartyl-tRNA(Asn)/glutamyl-tRNA(Gln) amidotransferase subunit A